jgi:hypothetical protein
VHSLPSCVLVPRINQPSMNSLVDDILRNRLPAHKNMWHSRFIVEEIPE